MTAAPQRQPLLPAVSIAAFFLAFYVCVWLWIDPSLLYHGAGILSFPSFSWRPQFLTEFVGRPGGLVEYASALLSQYFDPSWAGALIITAVAALLGLTTNAFLRAVAGSRIAGVWAVPAIGILIIYGGYGHQLAAFIALLLAMLAVCAYAMAQKHGVALRLGVFLALSIPLYYLCGGAYILYGVLCGILELRRRQGPLMGLCYLLLAELIPWAIGTHVFHLNAADTFMRLLPFHPDAYATGRAIVLSLYVFLVLSSTVAAIWSHRAAQRGAISASPPETSDRSSEAPRRKRSASKAKLTERPRSSRISAIVERLRDPRARWAVEGAVALLVATVVGLISFDGDARTMLRVNQFATQRRWPEVLREARKLPRSEFNHFVMAAVNRALYETGRLPYDLFAYPQHEDLFMVGLDIGTRASAELYRLRQGAFLQLGDTDLQLGLVNEAEHMAHETLENVGERPFVLKGLAFINIVKGNPEAAAQFLRALAYQPHYRAEAEEALRRLKADPTGSSDPEVRRLRSVMLRKRSLVLGVSAEQRLNELLKVNERNRMAFEYEMAAHLVGSVPAPAAKATQEHIRQLEKLVAELPRLDDFDYPEIPRLYQEAVVVYEDVTGNAVDLRGRRIDPDIRRAYDEFLLAYIRFHDRGDREGGWKALAPRFGDTYFFYYYFGESGAKRS